MDSKLQVIENMVVDVEEQDDMVEFPNEIMIRILSFLPIYDRKVFRLACKRFKFIIDYINEKKVNWKLKINENNIKFIKNQIENRNFLKLNFKHVDLDNIKSIQDLEIILETIGKRVEMVTVKKTAAFQCIQTYLSNLKHLQIHFDKSLRRNMGFLKFDEFNALEKLDFFENIKNKMPSVTNRLLYQLRQPSIIVRLKRLSLDVSREISENILYVFHVHGPTLEFLSITCLDPELFPDLIWGYICSRFCNLKILHLSGTCAEFCDIIIFHLPEKTEIEEIHLDYANDEILSLIVGKWRNSLQCLKLLDCHDITDYSAMELAITRKLRALNLSHCYKITSKGILRGIALQDNPVMEELYLSNLTKLNERCISLIATRLTNLRILCLDKVTKGVTNISLAQISRNLTQLRSLSINKCTKITDKGLIGFGRNPHSFKRLQYLEELNINGCPKLTDLVLFEGLNYKVLRTLNMCNCPKITFEGIKYLLKNCPLLETFGIPDRYANDNNALLTIRNGLKHLMRVNITFEYCLKATSKERDRVKDNIKGLFRGVSCEYK